MNAAGMILSLSGVSGALDMPYYQSLVADGRVSRGEFDGTRHNLSTAVVTLKKTPPEIIEAMVGEYDEELTAHFAKFNAIEQTDFLGGFKMAQVVEGYVSMIMYKSGLGG